MNGLPYYKAYPRDFIEGTIGMSFELKGAYRLVLDLIYMQGGNLPDDARYISGLLGCTVRRWNLLRAELIAADKIQVNDELLSNYRAFIELQTLAKLQDKQRENATGPRKNKDLAEAMAAPPRDYTEPEAEPDKQQPREASPQTDRERILAAIGADPTSGMIGPNGVRLGTMGDMAEAAKWSALGISTDDQCALILERVSRIRQKQPTFAPRSFGYFTGAMADFAAQKAAPMPHGNSQAKPDATAEKIARYRRRAGAAA